MLAYFYKFVITVHCSWFSVSDLHHFNGDPDPACHFVADGDPGPACHFYADPDPNFYLSLR
jgi:hypothetical protein